MKISGFASRPGYILGTNRKKDFGPLTIYEHNDPVNVVLRLVAVSDHWYEVEVNERTRQTKYILKSDPLWVKTKWDFWLANVAVIHPGPDDAPLLDKPDGKVIEASESIKVRYFILKGVEGD
jgi:hypothetical protein